MAVWPYVNHMTILAITILPDHMVYVWPYGVWLESLDSNYHTTSYTIIAIYVTGYTKLGIMGIPGIPGFTWLSHNWARSRRNIGSRKSLP